MTFLMEFYFLFFMHCNQLMNFMRFYEISEMVIKFIALIWSLFYNKFFSPKFVYLFSVHKLITLQLQKDRKSILEEKIMEKSIYFIFSLRKLIYNYMNIKIKYFFVERFF